MRLIKRITGEVEEYHEKSITNYNGKWICTTI